MPTLKKLHLTFLDESRRAEEVWATPSYTTNRRHGQTRTRGMSEGMGNGEYITTRVSKPDPGPVGSGVLPGSGSGFQISLDPDPVSAQILEPKKRVQKCL